MPISHFARVLASAGERAAATLSARLGPCEAELISQRITKLYSHTVGKGKCGRARLLMESFLALRPDAPSIDRQRVANVAVALETMQAFLVVADDMMDESETRRGDICWHRQKSIGLSAINDVLLLRELCENELRQSFAGDSRQDPVVSSFRKRLLATSIGQALDNDTSRQPSAFSWERYAQIVEMKTSEYSFVLPLELAALIAESPQRMNDICFLARQLGRLFQAQDDRLDVYEDQNITGKIGTDIQDGKCTWLSCAALSRLKDDRCQFRLARFSQHFGQSGNESVSVVKGIYDQLGLPDAFSKFEARATLEIEKDIDSLPIPSLRPVLLRVLRSIQERKK